MTTENPTPSPSVRFKAVYLRVSSADQSTESQEADVAKWTKAQDGEVRVYTDSFTGTIMSRPGMDEMLSDMRAGLISEICIWRLDRLGRNAAGVLALVDELKQYNVGLVSLHEGIDLNTLSGKLMVVILAGVAEFETGVRKERQMSGIAAVRAKNNGRCTWGGNRIPPGTVQTSKRVLGLAPQIRQMLSDGYSLRATAKKLGVSYGTVCRVRHGKVAGVGSQQQA